MGGSRKRIQTRKKSQKGGGFRIIQEELTPEILNATTLQDQMDLFFVSAHGESQVESYFCVPPNTFLLFNANAGDFGYMRGADRSWLKTTEEYYKIIYTILYGKENKNLIYNVHNYRNPISQIYFPGDFIPNNRVAFQNTKQSFRPMGVFKLPVDTENVLLKDNIWPRSNHEYADTNLMYSVVAASSINKSSLNFVPTEEMPSAIDKALAQYSNFPDLVGKIVLLSDVLKIVTTDKKYRFFFLPICRGAPLAYDPGRGNRPSNTTPAYKLFRRMSFHARIKTACPTSGTTLSLQPLFRYTVEEYEEMLHIAYTYLKDTGDQRFFDYVEELPTLQDGSPKNLTFYSFLIAMAEHPIPKEFKGTPLEISLKNLTKIFKSISKNIIEQFPAKNNTRRQPQQVLTNTFGQRETGYSFYPSATPRINEYGEEVGEVFSNAKNAPEHVKIARGNTI